ncbi:hypothetical protein PV04_02165 [Phialophora macrospora]|uniref:Uncharacterized protein n=1 Tax=Phialophora macrospora TaxID=1851006 RepID=A0A0D2E669_9EURO|nr:hypothetical protein PV04_02165 [Phialophora macrospora]
MEPYDPVKKYGAGWTRQSDGRELRVVIHNGSYYFQDRRTGTLSSIPDSISPRQERKIPRSEQDQQHQSLPERPAAQQDSRRREHQAQTSPGYEVRTAGAGSRSALYPSGAETAPSRREEPIQRRGPSHDAQDGNLTLENTSQDDLLLDFIAIPYGNFEECNDFIKKHKRILEIDLESLLDSAVQSRKKGDNLRSHRCVQRYVIIKACKSRNARDRDDYLYHLGGKGDDNFDRNEYARDFDQTLKQVSDRLEAGAASRREPTQSTFRNQGTGNDQRGMTDLSQPSYIVHGPPASSYRTQAIPSTATYATTSSLSPYGQLTSHYQFDQTSGQPPESNFPLQSGTTAPYTPTRRQSGLEDSQRPAALSGPTSRTNTNYDHGRKISQDQGDSKGSRVSRARPSRESQSGRDRRPNLPTANGLEGVEVRGQSQLQLADPQLLDPNYVLRTDAGVFFSVGRVFAMMFHENLGLKHGDPQITKFNSRYVTRGPKGEYIYSHIRRMAVIRQRQGYCICVPINSYRQRGISEKNVGEEGQAHAIVYGNHRATPPVALPGEPKFKKRPIAIVLKNGQELDDASRIHFGKFHSIEWNVKVMTIGHVAERSMADFETYWRQELVR